MPPDTSTPRTGARYALDLLMERHSPWPLAEPAPCAQDLDLVF